jgi:hypothetical protein
MHFQAFTGSENSLSILLKKIQRKFTNKRKRIDPPPSTAKTKQIKGNKI